MGNKKLKIQIKFFAIYRDKAGINSIELDFPEGSNVEIAAKEILRLYPKISIHPSDLVVAVNQEYVEHDHLLKEADEMALIPPVSGGSK